MKRPFNSDTPASRRSLGLITSNATTGEGIILVDTGRVPVESIRISCGYRIRMGVL